MTRARPRRVGMILLPVAVGVWAYLLRGFVSPGPLVGLSMAGPLLVLAGVRLRRGWAGESLPRLVTLAG